MTCFIVDAEEYPTTNHLARRILKHILALLEDARKDLLEEAILDYERMNEDSEKTKVINEADPSDLKMNLFDIRLIIYWLHFLRKELPNARSNPCIEFPLTIEDAIVKIYRLHSNYAVIGEETGNGDLEMAGFTFIEGFKQVKAFALPPPVMRIKLEINDKLFY